MKRTVLSSKKIHTDDTHVSVLAENKKQTQRGYLWVYVGDRDDVVFDYTPNRCREGPVRFLDGFQGYLQADAYNGYDAVFSNPAVAEVACWAHARRKFTDAFETDRVRCLEMLEYIRQLYAVEPEAKEKNLEAGGRFFLRLEASRPILETIKAKLFLAPLRRISVKTS